MCAYIEKSVFFDSEERKTKDKKEVLYEQNYSDRFR